MDRPEGVCATHTSSANNTISHCAAEADPYVPQLARASAADREKAQQLFDVVMQFCASHPDVESLHSAGYRPVHAGATHWQKIGARPGFRPNDPRVAVVDDQGKIVGVMYGGGSEGFPPLGSIPRPHVHMVGGNEMLHVWCTPDSLTDAFTTRSPETVQRMAHNRSARSAHSAHMTDSAHSTH